MQVLGELIITLGSAIIAYFAIAAESRRRGWSTGMTTGIYLAVFGGIAMGFNQLWALLAPKLVDERAGENALLVLGLLGIIVIVSLILDLTGKIQIMNSIQSAASQGQQQVQGATPSAAPQQQAPPRQDQQHE